MNDSELGTPLAQRTVSTPNGPVSISIGRPRPSSTNTRLVVCRYQIEGRAGAHAAGIDAISALLSAVHSVGAILDLPSD
ncbi:DUF6968 family protein [Nocardia cyriacigeorgica]|uniref:DUF6968 family protein n=1 Tax=Nocardia cyriacigeorgica TaxID=135487 RepID=UPI0024576770|nr:hypothetical protein [Nocardia cyriacigeorgica]